MIRRLAALLAVLALAAPVRAEVLYASISATGTAATTTLTRTSGSLTICNCSTSICSAGASANAAYVRVFSDTDTVAAATSSSTEIAIGACYEFMFDNRTESGTGYKYISALADSAGTATLKVAYK